MGGRESASTEKSFLQFKANVGGLPRRGRVGTEKGILAEQSQRAGFTYLKDR
jgi:hypothetical protein